MSSKIDPHSRLNLTHPGVFCYPAFYISRNWGDRQCALQGLEIIRVETPSGKELTTPPEVSFELLVVTLVAKRKQ